MTEILVEEMLKEKISEYKVIFLMLPMVLNDEVSSLLKEFVNSKNNGLLMIDLNVNDMEIIFRFNIRITVS